MRASCNTQRSQRSATLALDYHIRLYLKSEEIGENLVNKAMKSNFSANYPRSRDFVTPFFMDYNVHLLLREKTRLLTEL